MVAVAALVAGIGLGAVAAWLALRLRTAALLATETARADRLDAELGWQRRSYDDRLASLQEARNELEQAFKALSSEALRANNQSFLELARTQLEGFQTSAKGDLEKEKLAVAQLVAPIKESLDRVDGQVKSLERARREDYGVLTEQLRAVAEVSARLRTETASLVTALRAPATRGRWGEVQLRNAVETAGMSAFCDFAEQSTASTEDGLLRPDLIVRLPGGRTVVVDAKAPLQALLDAHEATDEALREAHMADFLRHVRTHMAKLATKAYWQQFDSAPDFVLMYLPGESFFRYAVESDSTLLDDRRVMLAGPANLIGLLRTMAVLCREQTLAEEARAISVRGRELYERLATMTQHLSKLGRQLDGAVASYNQTVGSFETRVLVSARRFPEHGIGSDREIPSVTPLERSTTPPQAIELPSRPDPQVALPLATDADADAA